MTESVTDARPNDHHKSTAKARNVGPPAVDENGKVVPSSKRWGFSARAFDNGEIRSNLFILALMGSFTLFNLSQTAFRLYDHLYRNYTSFQVNFFFTYAITFSWYFFLSGVFAFVDLTGRPRALFKYKVQPFQRVDGREYLHIAKIALRNFTVVVIPLVYFRASLTPARIDPRTLEGPWVTMGNLIFNLLCTEIGFYFIHRFFHSKLMYGRFHKQHHYMTAPVALASTYCTMTEHIFSNLLPNAIGTGIMKPHWSIQTCTFLILSTTTLCAHSGYNIPWLYSSLQHDYHHFAFNENFGPTGMLDTLFGTASRYHKALEDGFARSKNMDAARAELMSKLAAWEGDAATKKEL